MAKPHKPFARKRFGQNFLHDPAVIQRIVDAINPHGGEAFIEIGPGRGALTRPLLSRADHLTVIEIDRDLAAQLQNQHATKQNINIICQDVLAIKLSELANPFQVANPRWRVVGNLPYNISSPILFHLFDQMEHVQDLHVMLQKEVADRLTAVPGSKIYGRLSVSGQSYATISKLFDIGPGAFTPAPKVWSTVVKLAPLENPLLTPKDRDTFNDMVRFAFGQRRKTIYNALKPFFEAHAQSASARELLNKANIDPGARAEQLSVQQFIQLAQQVQTTPSI